MNYSAAMGMSISTDFVPASSALSRRHMRLAPLSQRERLALDELETDSEWVNAGSTILSHGQVAGTVMALLEGLAYRHKDFRDGRRQITTMLLPGDICGAKHRGGGPTDYGVRALTRARVARINRDQFEETLATYPGIARALAAVTLVEEAVLRAWLVNLGQREGLERMAHFLSELAQRMNDCGLLLSPGVFALPLTQQELGSVLGLTNVHINRILRRMRDDHLVDFQRGLVRIHDFGRLHAIAEFDPRYLSN